MNIIGQKKLLSDIDALIINNQFPRFSILVGTQGVGKKLIASYIAKKLNATFVPCEISVDGVRDVIDTCYSVSEPIVYLFADADSMSINAKNAILKVVEEPPMNAYFIMTTETTQGLLNTLFSRGHQFLMNPYKPEEILEFTKKYNTFSNSQLSYVSKVAKTCLDVEILSNTDITQMFKIIDVLINSITTANLANVLKISTFLKYKADDTDTDHFDAVLFVRSYVEQLINCMKSTPNVMYKDLLDITNQYLIDLSNKSLSKQATIDNWLIDLHLRATKEVYI